MDSKNIYICSNYSDYDFKSDRIWRLDGSYEPFVYIIEEISTGMKYIGSRTYYQCLESDLGTKYFTSSNYVNWTKDEFKILEIIKCASNHDAIILEEIIIRENNAVFDDSFYNKHHQNIGFHGSVNKGKRSEEHTSELQSRPHLVCRLLLEKKKK